MSNVFGSFIVSARRAIRRAKMSSMRGLFEGHGKDFWFDPDGVYSYRNITVGSNVSFGLGCVVVAAESKVRIGSHVMFGPNVTLVGGGHNIDLVGLPMAQVRKKSGKEDLGVIIEDDVWIGTGAIVLRGVIVGRGAVVAAGSIVTKSVPPYSIVGGNPARVLRFRWTVEEILRHESLLYLPEERLSQEEVLRVVSSPSMLPRAASRIGDADPVAP